MIVDDIAQPHSSQPPCAWGRGTSPGTGLSNRTAEPDLQTRHSHRRVCHLWSGISEPARRL